MRSGWEQGHALFNRVLKLGEVLSRVVVYRT